VTSFTIEETLYRETDLLLAAKPYKRNDNIISFYDIPLSD